MKGGGSYLPTYFFARRRGIYSEVEGIYCTGGKCLLLLWKANFPKEECAAKSRVRYRFLSRRHLRSLRMSSLDLACSSREWGEVCFVFVACV